ncbi:hypothetical protein [Amnibacterium endophyticum]|uniref:Transmembrane protein n=1 Tax=Amnibacterium endophyticum TaxID=2109337 RepID=A0ABW4LEI5_9MICO
MSAHPTSDHPEFPGATEREDALLRHVVFTGTVWFCGAVVAVLLPLTGLLASGWRPHDLAGGAQAVWWSGGAVALAGVLGIAWAGCPVVSADPGRAAARKSVTIRAGIALLLLGFVVAVTTTLVA